MGAHPFEASSDEQLLLEGTDVPGALGEFYVRHERHLLGYFMRRSGSAELAADLTAETFAEVITSRHKFDPARGSAVAWLFGIAHHVMSRSERRGRVEDRARRKLGFERLVLDDDALSRVEAVASETGELKRLLGSLPEAQRAAIAARVLDERGYREIAADMDCSESVVRQRVKRGLTRMRHELEVER